MNESCPTYEWVMSHISICHVPHVNVLLSRIYRCSSSSAFMLPRHCGNTSVFCLPNTAALFFGTMQRWHDSFIHVTWLVYTCDMAHSYVWHDSFIYVWLDSFICVAWLIHMCDMTHSYVCHDSFICVIWLIRMCDMTHSYVWHDSFICVTWLIHMCDMTHIYVWHDLIICVAWLICMCDMTNIHQWHDSYFCFWPTQHRKPIFWDDAQVTWLIYICAMTHSDVWHDTFTCMIWLIHTCEMTHTHMWHDSYTHVTWLIHTIHAHSYVRHDSFTRVKWLMLLFFACGVAMISRLLQIIGLFCKRALWKRLYSAKETYNFKEPTNRSHPIPSTAAPSFGTRHRWDDSFTYVPWLIYMCDMTHSYVRHDFFIHVTCLIHKCDRVSDVCCSVLQCVAVCCSVL